MNFIKGLFKGLTYGLGVGLALFAIAYILEFIDCLLCGCFGNCITCSSPYSINPRCVGWACGENGGPWGPLDGLLPIWNLEYFINTLSFCAIAGTIIGTVYGISKEVQEVAESRRIAQMEEEQRRRNKERAVLEKKRAEEEAALAKIQEEAAAARAKKQAEEEAERRQQLENAREFKERANEVRLQCANYMKVSGKNIEKPNFDSVTLQTDLWNVISDVSLPLQRLDNIVAEMKEKEDM